MPISVDPLCVKYESLLADVFRVADPAQLERVFAGDECELDGDFLGFLNVYAGAAYLARVGTAVLDFGCYAGVQAVFFPDARAYIGVDVYEGPRYEAANVQHYTASIQDWLAQHGEAWSHQRDVLAICSYVPDPAARRLVREGFDNVVSYYPCGLAAGSSAPGAARRQRTTGSRT